MENDISNKTIVVLVVLTVIISVLSTLVVLNEVANVRLDSVKAAKKTSSSSGQVSLVVLPSPDSTTGRVTLEIKPDK